MKVCFAAKHMSAMSPCNIPQVVAVVYDMIGPHTNDHACQQSSTVVHRLGTQQVYIHVTGHDSSDDAC